MIREEKGFSLIELALILVIIGIIISIVLKGQDVVESSRMKRFESEIRHWRTSAWLYLERKGTFPGDADQDGIIGNESTGVIPGSTVIQNANLINPPKANPVSSGSLNFWIYWGYDGGGGTGSRALNVMVICANDACDVPFGGNDKSGNMKYVEFIDAVVDGEVDGTEGLVKASSVSPEFAPPNTGNDRAVTSVGPPGAWTSEATMSLIYYVEKAM